ncbi:MAG: hypothetical protein JSV82_01870 [Planctomycetota bacterium]|nr:MAG: hypothetical protein JSV82_01870 [Planctomycetota bacterium]
MHLALLTTDNISELLLKILEFTQSRQKVLIENIKKIYCFDFVPKDLAVDEFCCQMSGAIVEHLRSQRLLFSDTENIKFGSGGSFEAIPSVDTYAEELLEEDKDEYLRLQIDKLLENSLNQRIAAELLRQRQGIVPIFE